MLKVMPFVHVLNINAPRASQKQYNDTNINYSIEIDGQSDQQYNVNRRKMCALRDIFNDEMRQ